MAKLILLFGISIVFPVNLFGYGYYGNYSSPYRYQPVKQKPKQEEYGYGDPNYPNYYNQTQGYEEESTGEEGVVVAHGMHPVEPQTRYDGDQLWKLHTTQLKDKIVLKLRKEFGGEVWNRNQDGIDLYLKRDSIEGALKYIKNTDLTYNIMIENIQKWVDDTNTPSNNTLAKEDTQQPSMTFDEYHDLDDFYDFYFQLIENYPYLCSMQTIGRTEEGREIKILKISNGIPTNPVIFIESGMDAREWIGPAASSYVLHEIILNWKFNPDFVKNLDWYFLLVSNPDGYEYSRNSQRLWSKNRSVRGSSDNSCVGVNIDRNFGYLWGKVGSSDDPCSRNYRGPSKFSEPESRAIRNIVNSLKGRLQAYISVGGYGQLVTYPWGDADLVPANEKELYRVAVKSIKNIRRATWGEYRVGSQYRLGFAKSGNALDWIKDSRDVRFTYGLRLKDQGRHGFLLPPELIEEAGKEAAQMILTVAKSLAPQKAPRKRRRQYRL